MFRTFLKSNIKQNISSNGMVITLIFLLFNLFSFGQNQPNILFILADDMGINDLGCYGNKFYETPNIDKLSEEGIQFRHHYSAGAVCSPTRTSIITGKFPARTHSTEVYNWGIDNKYFNEPLLCEKDKVLSKNQVFLADELRKQGYKTAIFGKWHIEGVNPGETGFDESLINHNKTKEGQDANNDEFHINKIHQLSSDFMESCVENKTPFFAFVSHHSVHVPQASTTRNREYFEAKGALSEWTNRPSVQTPVYAGMVKDLDEGIGNLLSKLDELEIKENTIVVFTSDNGGLGERNFPHKGGKSREWEGGIRVPFIVRWPGVITAGTESNQVVVSTDYFKTFINIAGGTINENAAPDSEFFLPVLQGKEIEERKAAIFHFPHYRGNDGDSWLRPWSVIRKSEYVYIFHWEAELTPELAEGSSTQHELYDVVTDPGQKNNLINTKSEIANSLKKELISWLEDNNAQIPVKNTQQDSIKKKDDPIAGAIRWDAQIGSSEFPYSMHEIGALSPTEWHYRLPFYTEINGGNSVFFSAQSPDVMEQEIAFAKDANLDYWAFLLYENEPKTQWGYGLNIQLENYLASPNKNDVNFCMILPNKDHLGEYEPGWDRWVHRFMNYMREPSYQTVLDGRPLVYAFRYNDWSKAPFLIQTIKDSCLNAGIPNPYFVDLHWSNTLSNGFDAMSSYTNHTGSTQGLPYIEQAEHDVNVWKERKQLGTPQVPVMTLGWDGRPRLQYPNKWSDEQSLRIYTPWVEHATPEELAGNLRNAVDFVNENPENCKANAILMYAWNEFAEGGWLCPNLPEYGGNERLEAMKPILKGGSGYVAYADSIIIKNSPLSIPAGDTITLTAEIIDQKGNKYNLDMNVIWVLSSGSKTILNDSTVQLIASDVNHGDSIIVTASTGDLQTTEKIHISNYRKYEGTMTYSGEINEENGPENAFDGLTGTYTELKGYPRYLQLEYDSISNISFIKYFTRPGYEARMPGLQIQCSNDGNTWETVYKIKEGEAKKNVWNAITFNSRLSCRYFRFFASNWLTVAEIEVWGLPDSEYAVAFADSIRMQNPPSKMAVEDTVLLMAQVADQYGRPFDLDLIYIWSVNAGTLINDSDTSVYLIASNLNQDDEIIVTATADTFQTSVNIVVDNFKQFTGSWFYEGEITEGNGPGNASDGSTESYTEIKGTSRYLGLEFDSLSCIEGIRYFTRPGYESRMDGLRIQASENGNHWTNIYVIRSGEAKTSIWNTITFEPQVKTKYIKLLPYNWLVLAEIEVLQKSCSGTFTHIESNQALNNEIKVFPNPTRSTVYFNRRYQYTLYNSVGIKLEENISDHAILKLYPNGIYFVKIGHNTFKVVKH